MGARQHGHITAVGFHLYTRLLGDAVKQLRGRDGGASSAGQPGSAAVAASELQFGLDSLTLPPVAVDAQRLGHALDNLLVNAATYTEPGGKITLSARRGENGRVELAVKDTGVGIPPEGLRLIFEPFYTTKEPDEHGHGGTGLGLSVCRQIIEQHHGRIRVESVVGRGSTFTVKLPLKPEEGKEHSV